MRGVYPDLHAPKGTKRIEETNRMVWKSRKRFFGREEKDAGGHKKSLNGSGFNQRIDEAELAGEFPRVQPGEESLLEGQAVEHLAEHGDGFLRVQLRADFARRLRPLDDVAPQLPVFLEQGGELRPGIGVILPHLHQQVEVVEVVAASLRVVPVIQQAHDAAHGLFHALHVVVDELQQRAASEAELVVGVLRGEDVFVHHRHEQVLLEGVVVNQPPLGQPAGFGDSHQTCLLVVHLGEHPQGVLQHFFPVCYHKRKGFMFLAHEGRENLRSQQALYHYFYKQQIESRELDYQRNDIDSVVEQILFLFVKLGEILPVLIVLEYK